MCVPASRSSIQRLSELVEEFDRKTGPHRSESVHIPHPGGSPLVPDQVFSLDTGDSVGLTKADFAACVAEGRKGFDGIDFEGFRRTFELIEQAVARMAVSASR